MWSKTVTAFLLSVRVKKERAPAEPPPFEEDGEPERKQRGFRLFFAFPVPLLLMFVDMAEDWALLFAPFAKSKTAGRLAKRIWTGVRLLKALTFEICFETGPTDFLDVDVRDKSETVRVRISTR